MSSPASAREALIAEVLGDIAGLLDRIDSVVSALETAALAATNASAGLEAKAKDFEASTRAFVEAAKTHLVKHVASQTDGLVKSALDSHVQELRLTVLELIRTELSTIRRRGEGIRHRGTLQDGHHALWGYALTAAVASSMTCVAMTYLLST